MSLFVGVVVKYLRLKWWNSKSEKKKRKKKIPLPLSFIPHHIVTTLAAICYRPNELIMTKYKAYIRKVLDYGHFQIPLTKHLLTRDHVLSPPIRNINLLQLHAFPPFHQPRLLTLFSTLNGRGRFLRYEI